MAVNKVAEVFPPGEFIREEIEARGWSQNDLADIIGRHPNVVSELILGKRSITPDTAKALAVAFGTTAQFWMNLQTSYELGREDNNDTGIARRAKLYELAPIKDMIKRHWIERSENVDVLERQVLKFFEVSSIDQTPAFSCAARKSTSYIQMSSAERAWLVRARQLARAIHAARFSKSSFEKALQKLKTLMANAEDVRHVPKLLAEHGIRFLIVEHLPRTKIDGVTFWLDPESPVIVLSIRYDRIDSFWYTLSHELAHVRSRDGLGSRQCVLDTELVGDESYAPGDQDDRTEEERQADLFAEDFLVTREELNNFIRRTRPLYSKAKIRGFAHRLNVHPGIVVGQLQYRREVTWAYYRMMLEKVRHNIVRSALTDGWGHIVSIDRSDGKSHGKLRNSATSNR